MSSAASEMDPLIAAHLVLHAPTAGPAGLAEVTRRWFDGAPALGGDLWQRATTSSPGKTGAERWPAAPGQAWAEIAVDRGWDRGFGPWSQPRWDDLLAATSASPAALLLTAYELAEVGGRVYPGFPRLSVSARYTTRRTGQWWGLKVQTSPEYAPALLDLLHEVAGVGVPTYGEISFDNAGHLDHATSFEHNLGRFPWRTVVDSATTLRGYSWLTIAAASIVEAIGGPAVLRSSAAFVHVEQLPGGSYWLQATPTLAEYGPAEAAAVQAALAPALQPGLPRPDLDGEAPHRLALVDAHPDRPVARHSDDGDIFGHRVDTRDSTAHGIALAVRMSTLKSRFRKALIWGATSHEAGPHLVCWGARAGEVWVWQVEPADEADGGLEIARDLRPVLSAVALDPLSAGMRVRPGPTFAELGLPAVESAADAAFGAFGSVQVADAGPGRQVRQALEQAPRSDDQNRTARVVARAVKLREAVLASAPPVRERRLDRGTYAGWLNQP